MSVRFIRQESKHYTISLIDMEIAKEGVINGERECVFLAEHNPLYSAGKSFEPKDFLMPPRYPIYFPRRGGRVTVHAPGQLVVYPIINLLKRNINIHAYITILESWMIHSLSQIGVRANRSSKGIGVWINESKVGFIGVRIERGISTHGFCLNVSNDLSMFDSIIPCGIDGLKVTSLELSQNKKFQISQMMDLFVKTSPL